MREREPLQFIAIGASGGTERRLLLDVHLPMEYVHAVNANRGRFLNDRFDRDFRRTKVPVRVGGNAELDPLPSGFVRPALIDVRTKRDR